jgi:hypothetical protein
LRLDLTLELVEDDPPAIRMQVTLNGQVLVNGRGISAAACLAITQDVEKASPDANAVQAPVRAALEATAQRLQQIITDADRAQRARKQLLNEWQPVISPAA